MINSPASHCQQECQLEVFDFWCRKGFVQRACAIINLLPATFGQPQESHCDTQRCMQLPRGQVNLDMPSDKTHERRPRHERSRSRDRRNHSPTPASDNDLPQGVSPISKSDYFLKNTEFRMWLREEKHKVCPMLGSVESRIIANC